MFLEKSINQFLDELASEASVPGGGSGSALGGALAAGLLSMVCNLTIGKKAYADTEEDMKEILVRSEDLRARLSVLLEEDTQVYGQVMTAYQMPKVTAQEKTTRAEAIQATLKEAADVPLQIAECCSQIIDLCGPAAQKGNKWAVSDAGVSVLLAEASLRGSLLNVEINLASIKDQDYVTATKKRIKEITQDKVDSTEDVMAVVLRSIRGE